MKLDLIPIKQAVLGLKNSIVSKLLIVLAIACLAIPTVGIAMPESFGLAAQTAIGYAMPSAIATGLFDLPSFDPDQVWVVDTADAISTSNQSKLTNTFKDLADKTGQEVRMVAIRRLDYGETVDSLADEIFKDWYSNPEVQANQTLIVLDTLTNNVAIRTGKSTQALVTSDIAQSIVNDTVGYNIRKGNKYNQAFIDAGDRLVAVLSGQPDPGPPAMEDEVQIEGTFTKAEDTDQGSATIWVIGFLIVATIIPMATYYWYVGFGD